MIALNLLANIEEVMGEISQNKSTSEYSEQLNVVMIMELWYTII